jgi:hypothetical protein
VDSVRVRAIVLISRLAFMERWGWLWRLLFPE